MFLFRSKQNDHLVQSSVRDRPIRSIFKAITWRIVGTLDTITLSYFVTGRVGAAISIGSLEVVTKMVLYFLHERLWAIVRWGRMLVVFRRNTRFTQKILKKLTLR